MLVSEDAKAWDAHPLAEFARLQKVTVVMGFSTDRVVDRDFWKRQTTAALVEDIRSELKSGAVLRVEKGDGWSVHRNGMTRGDVLC